MIKTVSLDDSTPPHPRGMASLIKLFNVCNLHALCGTDYVRKLRGSMHNNNMAHRQELLDPTGNGSRFLAFIN